MTCWNTHSETVCILLNVCLYSIKTYFHPSCFQTQLVWVQFFLVYWFSFTSSYKDEGFKNASWNKLVKCAILLSSILKLKITRLNLICIKMHLHDFIRHHVIQFFLQACILNSWLRLACLRISKCYANQIWRDYSAIALLMHDSCTWFKICYL